MSQRIIESNTLVQSFFDHTIYVIKKNAELAFQKLSYVPGLLSVMPHGPMYMMVRVDMKRFPGITSDL